MLKINPINKWKLKHEWMIQLFINITSNFFFFNVHVISLNINDYVQHYLSGDKLRVDLRKKDIPSTKMSILEQKFDEAKVNGQLLPSALSSAVSNNDELDNPGQVKAVSRLVKRSVSSNIRKPQSLDVQGKLELWDKI